MILKETLWNIAFSQREELMQDLGIKRTLLQTIDLQVPQALIITGVRRCGKSILLQQLMKIQPHHHYFNFEDQRVASFDISDFEKLEEVLLEMNPRAQLFFFDEIQNIPQWELFVRKLLNSRKKSIITGSNASLLSKELGTRLTGRHLDYELFPFSFQEYAEFRQAKLSQKTAEDYLQEGGFPEYLKFKKKEYLQTILKDILTKDINVRHKLREGKVLLELTNYIISNVGKEFTSNSLAKIFKVGSPTTIINYLSYLEESYLIFIIPRFSYSLKKQAVNPKKIYSIDNGLVKANSAAFSEDKGRMLENAVFVQLRRQYKEIYYYKEQGECDFLIKEKGKIVAAFQVCWELNSDNLERELNGLKEALSQFNLKRGTIITFNQKDTLGEIEAIPFWKWANFATSYELREELYK